MSGLKGHYRKMRRIERSGKPKYRSGQISLAARVDKKLLEKYNWFRKRQPETDSEDGDENESDEKKKKRKWCHYMRKKEPIAEVEKEKR